MERPYAVVMGEALVDLLETTVDGVPHYREAIGGGPLNVAVGVARLGHPVELVGSVGDDVPARRIRALLSDAGVGTAGLVTAPVGTTLALATFDGSEPVFRFYGNPPSYGELRACDVDLELVARAAVLYTGSIALLCPASLGAARAAWAVPGPLRVFDPNVRPLLLDDPAGLRAIVAEFAATADLVKLSAADASVLYGVSPEEVASLLTGAGARAVVVTMGGDGALVRSGTAWIHVAAPAVTPVDTTGAGDATMAGLIHGLLPGDARPATAGDWRPLVRFAVTAGALTCRAPGGAAAMPTRAEVERALAA